MVFFCCLGDYHLQHPVAKQHVLVAIGDSITHGIIAGLSWAIVCDFRFKRPEVVQCVVCVFLGMAVDIDHFIAAGSFSLKAALSLPTRPPFHASTLIAIVDIIMLLLAAILDSQNLFLGAMIFTTAWFSHHVRDGHRRGLWFYPFGKTPPLSETIYLGTIIIFPLLIKLIFDYFVKHRLKDKTLDMEEGMV